MLSVLIPCFNYNIVALVKELHLQLVDTNIAFEILCLEDGSNKEHIASNAEINDLEYTKQFISTANKGRITTRLELANNSKYNWLLFLDADVMPRKETFVSEYLDSLSNEYDAVYGGFYYKEQPTNINARLRWKFGLKKEQVEAKVRNKKPCKVVISGNFLIKKDVFIQLNNSINSKGYGYDNFFGARMKHFGTKILHIDNEVFHLGIEDNDTYIGKVRQAVQTLNKLYQENQTLKTQNDLLESFKFLKRFKINFLFAKLYSKFYASFESNLKSKNPSLWLLQCYKLSYLSHLDLKTK